MKLFICSRLQTSVENLLRDILGERLIPDHGEGPKVQALTGGRVAEDAHRLVDVGARSSRTLSPKGGSP